MGRWFTEKCGRGRDQSLAETGRARWKWEIVRAIEETVCAASSQICQVEKVRASRPARLPFLSPWQGKQDVFHPVQLRDQSLKATRLKLTSICSAAHSAPLQHTQSYSSHHTQSTTPCWTVHKLLPLLRHTPPRPLDKTFNTSSQLIAQFITSTSAQHLKPALFTIHHMFSDVDMIRYVPGKHVTCVCAT